MDNSRNAKRALIYGRISKPRPRGAHDDGAEDLSDSIERQIRVCEHTAAARGYELVAVERDTQSAYLSKTRPGWERAKAMVERGEVDVVIAWQLDRVTRSVAELEDVIEIFERTGASLLTAAGDIDLTTATGRLVVRILAAVARAEVELKTARMQLANQQRAADGKRRRSAPRLFGYNADGTVNRAEADLVQQGASDVLAGASLLAIARRWNASGMYSDSRARIGSGTAPGWSSRGVKDCLTNPRHAGLAIYQGQIIEGVKGEWEPILDEETHFSLVATLSDPSRRVGDHKRGRRPGDLLLSTVAKCGKEGCDRHLNAGKRAGVPVYVCKSGHVTIPAHKVDMLVTSEVVRGLAKAAIGGYLRVTEREEIDSSQLGPLHERLDALAGAYAEGAVTLSQMTKATRTLQAKIAAIEEAMANQGTKARALSPEEAYEIWANASVDGQRELIREGFEIVVSPVGKGQKIDPVKQVSVRLREKSAA